MKWTQSISHLSLSASVCDCSTARIILYLVRQSVIENSASIDTCLKAPLLTRTLVRNRVSGETLLETKASLE